MFRYIEWHDIQYSLLQVLASLHPTFVGVGIRLLLGSLCGHRASPLQKWNGIMIGIKIIRGLALHEKLVEALNLPQL
jgi:hypothetical protein